MLKTLNFSYKRGNLYTKNINSQITIQKRCNIAREILTMHSLNLKFIYLDEVSFTNNV